MGDTITVCNPSKEEQTYTLTICGIFQNETTDSYANTTFTSYSSLNAIDENTEINAEEVINDRGMTSSTALRTTTNGTYVFYDIESYENFCEDVESMGLDTEVYTVSSSDLNQYEKSVVPLESLSKFTMLFFVVVLLIGGGILVIFNIFTVRERKYEIGVLAAIGMKKGKVALQFLTEIFMVTLTNYFKVIFKPPEWLDTPFGRLLFICQVITTGQNASCSCNEHIMNKISFL